MVESSAGGSSLCAGVVDLPEPWSCTCINHHTAVMTTSGTDARAKATAAMASASMTSISAAGSAAASPEGSVSLSAKTEKQFKHTLRFRSLKNCPR